MMDSFQTTSDAYLATLATLLDEPDFVCIPRGLPCRELMNWQFVVEHPASGPIVTASTARNEVIRRYQMAEMELYLSGELRASVWAEKASKFWAKLANPDGTINSNYGWLIFDNGCLPGRKTPWQWARDRLLEDLDTRQAYVRVSLPWHQQEGVRDQVCTMHLNFLFREDRLHATAVMRSNDVVKGLVYDMPFFIHLLELMCEQVKLKIGTYSHIAHSLHLYERDRKIAEEMLGRQ